MKNEVVKFGVILFVITAVCTGIVSFIYGITDPIIQTQKIEKDNNARQEILPLAKNFKKIEQDFGGNIVEVYEGLNIDEVVGYTIKTTSKGYGGDIEITTGITSEGKISGVTLGSMSETPGLGAKAKDEAFISQYNDQDAKEMKVVKNGPAKDLEIVAIAGATITSDAVTNGVNEAIKLFENELND